MYSNDDCVEMKFLWWVYQWKNFENDQYFAKLLTWVVCLVFWLTIYKHSVNILLLSLLQFTGCQLISTKLSMQSRPMLSNFLHFQSFFDPTTNFRARAPVIFWTSHGKRWGARKLGYTGWPKKSKPPPIFQKNRTIANEIRFLRKVKVWIKHYNTSRW